jgi:hypothetical protein
MKLNKYLCTTILTIALLTTGCNTDNQQFPNADQTETIAEEPTSQTPLEEDRFLETSLALLGQTHEDSDAFFESNEELYSADGNYLIGRNYPVVAFGIDTNLYTSLNTEGIINSISVHLGENNFEEMEAALVKELGQATEINDTPSESGATYAKWCVEDFYVYLYKGYGTIDLQLIMPDPILSSQVDAQLVNELPNTIMPVLGESQPYPLLQQFIIDTYGIPEEYYAKTKYYYNFVDFNGDGRNEIFAVVMGPYTSGTGGSSALIAYEFENEIREVTTLTLIHTPLIISDSTTKGMKDIIALRSGGGADQAWVQLTSTGEGHYCSINDGKVLDTLEGIKGQAIIANDIIYDIDHALFMTLEK